ncbi:MAG TPA: MotA/TolQ/ExbB proton channel family protein [Planctomycetota bacterium]|nr:MotA/TolQ/ExbB proton channel family protein [Planctomycetota bacterium]
MYRLYLDPCGIALILYSVAALALIVERLLAWRRSRARTRAFAADVQQLLASPDRQKLKEAFERSDAPLGQVMSYVLRHDTSASPETTLLLLDDALELASGQFKRRLPLLAALAGTAPFLGLLGTVLGIMNTFFSIVQKGFGGPTVISAGIAQALQTTAVGLVIAIPAYVAYNLLTTASDNAVRDLRTQANRIFVALGDL